MGKQSYKIQELVSKIERGEIRLPEMQRSYVWTAPRIRDLLDSLYRDYPSGTILTWETGEDVSTREFSIKQKKPSKESFQLLLDGQQRLTSLSAILRGEPLCVRDRKRPIDILFNLEHPEDTQFVTEVNDDVYDEDEDPETADANEKDIFNRNNSRTFIVKNKQLAKQPQWISVTDVFKDENDSRFLKGCGIENLNDPRYEKYTKRLKKLRDIKRYTYDVNVLERNKSYEEVTDIFVRVNSLGAKLRGSDLALAQITAKWPKSLHTFEKFQQECKEQGFDYDLGIFIKNLVVFTTRQSKFKTVSGLSKDALHNGWEYSKRGFQYALNFLKDNVGIDSPALLSTPYLIITLGYFAHQNDFRPSPEMVKELRYWLLVANAKGRYSRGSSETYLDQDIATIINKKQNLPAMISDLSKQFGRLEVLPEDLSGRDTKSAYFKTMFLIFKKDGAKDWSDGLGISLNHYGLKHKIQFHHIFPQDPLKKERFHNKKINDIANLSFIGGGTNRKISNKPPLQYLPDIVSNQGQDALTKQCIPIDQDLWKIENYDKFLQERRTLIAKRINEFIGDDPFENNKT